jgi:hypothetical protein
MLSGRTTKACGRARSAAWQVSGVDAQGNPALAKGVSADLCRRQSDGRWLLVVDNPFGAATES